MKINKLSTLALALTLAACGGGGGGSPTTPTPSNPTSYTVACPNGTTAISLVSPTDTSVCPVPTSVPIVTSVPAATYAAGSQEKAAYDYLNNARSTCGFGLLAQSAQLDTAAGIMRIT